MIALVVLIGRAIAAERAARHGVRACVDRSRVARAIGVVIAVIAAAVLLSDWSGSPYVLPAAIGYAVIVAVIEGRREPSDPRR